MLMESVRVPSKPFKISLLADNLHFVLFGALGLLLVRESTWYLLLIIPVLLKSRWIWMIGALLILFRLEINPSKEFTTCTVIRVDTSSICNVGYYNVKILDQLPVGTVVSLGEAYPTSEPRSPFSFDYEKYLLANRIIGVYASKEVEVLSQDKSIYEIRSFIRNYIETFDEDIIPYLSAMIIGDRSYFEEDLYQSFGVLGITHLFAISGLHVAFFVGLLQKVTKKTSVSILFLITFMVVAGFSVSVVRAGIMMMLSLLLKKHFTSLDTYSITTLGFLLFNPDIIYDVAFQLSFLVTFSLIVTASLFPTTNVLKQLLLVSLIAQIATLPVIVSLNGSIPLHAIWMNVVFVLFVSAILLPVIVLTLFIPEFSLILLELIQVFEVMITGSLAVSEPVYIPAFSYLQICLFYIGVYALFQKEFLAIILLLFSFSLKQEFVMILDVGNGNSVIIDGACTMMIDTGPGSDRIQEEVSLALRKTGNQRIDYLFLSHGDYDHSGGYPSLIESFDVQTLVINEYTKDPVLFEYVELAHQNGIQVRKVSAGDIVCGVKVLAPNKVEDTDNNESLVLAYQSTRSYLFLGDSELLNTYYEVDVLLLAHHGSLDATNQAMLDVMKPEFCLISTGPNPYGHPHPEVLAMLKGCVVMRTDVSHTILFTENEVFTTSSYKEYLRNMV